MLTHRHLTANRTTYYLADLATELPAPHGPGPDNGVWLGATARAMGLAGAVAPDVFRDVLEGRHPITGQQLRSTRATVGGYDLTFSAPKSASVLMALGGDEVARQIVTGHGEAVRGALGYLEAHGIGAARRQGAERTVISTEGVVAASFTHGVNRNLDPHLHSHVVMANLVHGEDGRWSACDQRGISAHQQAAGAVYESHLRSALTARLGVQWSQAPLQQAEIEGVAPVLLGEFSSRAADIRRHSFETGTHSVRGHRIAWAVTRPGKELGTSFDDLAVQWHHRAGVVLGNDPDLLPTLGHRSADRPSVSEHQFAGVLWQASDGGARRRDVTAAFAQAARDGAPAADIERLTDQWVPDSEQVGIAEPAYPRHTVLPGAHHLRALGPRPLDPVGHAVWRDAAQGIDRYRQQWQVNGPEALGATSDQPRWPTRRVVDHLRATSQLDQARARLGRSAAAVVELDRGR